MPITQERMISLLNAAIDYEQAFTKAVKIFNHVNSRVAKGEITWPEGWAELDFNIKHMNLLQNPIDSSKIIAIEHKHFKDHGQKNLRDKIKQARRRNDLNLGRQITKRKQNLGSTQYDYLQPGLPEPKAPMARPKTTQAYPILPPDPSLEEDPEAEAQGQDEDQGLAMPIAGILPTKPTLSQAEIEAITREGEQLAEAKEEVFHPGSEAVQKEIERMEAEARAAQARQDQDESQAGN